MRICIFVDNSYNILKKIEVFEVFEVLLQTSIFSKPRKPHFNSFVSSASGIGVVTVVVYDTHQ